MSEESSAIAPTVTTTIDLLRHGQCEGGEIFRGSTDVALTDQGWMQMREATQALTPWSRLVSSPMLRCRQFSEELSANRSLPMTTFDAFREIHFGDWEGRPQLEIQKNNGELLKQFWNDPLNCTPPNGEAIVDFQSRVMSCFNQQLAEHRGQHWLLVSHGAVMRIIMCSLLKMPLTSISNIAVPYACLTRFRIYETEGEEPWVQLCFHRGE